MKIKTPIRLLQKRIIESWNYRANLLLLNAPKIPIIIKDFEADPFLPEAINYCELTENEVIAMINNDIKIKFNIKYPAHVHFTLTIIEYNEDKSLTAHKELTEWSKWIYTEEELKSYIQKNYLKRTDIYINCQINCIKIAHFFNKKYSHKKEK